MVEGVPMAADSVLRAGTLARLDDGGHRDRGLGSAIIAPYQALLRPYSCSEPPAQLAAPTVKPERGTGAIDEEVRKEGRGWDGRM